jgi:DNA ligase D-like protein (predicted 3'-phosphoesterase)
MMLEEYAKKRKFANTTEPKPLEKITESKNPIFVVQKHNASHLHYDFRLSIDGVLKSWAIPKEIPISFGKKVLAVQTEDHPIEYASFHGTIPKGEYGAGTVRIWDKGNFEIIDGSVEKGHLHFKLRGGKLKEDYTLLKFKTDKKKNLWLLFKNK